jgi:hypothetical protein
MKLSKASRPSPALVLAALALVFAMVGTAIAGPDAISNKITKPKVKNISKKQANKVLDQRESSLDVNSAKRADNANNADNADNAVTADGPAAWAHLSSTGTVLAGRGVEAGNVSAGAAGYWCFSGLEFEFRGLQATVDYWNGTGTFDTIAQASVVGQGNASTGGTGCAAGTQAFVRGSDASDSTTNPVSFFITFLD